MSTRPTHEIKLPVTGKSVTLNGWLTVGEEEYIDEPIMKAARMQTNFQSAKKGEGTIELDATSESQRQHRMYEKMIASIDGNSDSIIEQVLELPSEDGKYLRDRIQEILEKKDLGGK